MKQMRSLFLLVVNLVELLVQRLQDFGGQLPSHLSDLVFVRTILCLLLLQLVAEPVEVCL